MMGMFSDDPRPVVVCDPKDGQAKQEFAAECDINNIMAKYRTSGLVSHLAANAGRFSDVTEVGSYRDAIDRVRDTHSFFAGLPASLRAEFENDPAFFLDYISDPANFDEVSKMGLEELIEPVVEVMVDPPLVEPVVAPVLAPEAPVEGS